MTDEERKARHREQARVSITKKRAKSWTVSSDNQPHISEVLMDGINVTEYFTDVTQPCNAVAQNVDSVNTNVDSVNNSVNTDNYIIYTTDDKCVNNLPKSEVGIYVYNNIYKIIYNIIFNILKENNTKKLTKEICLSKDRQRKVNKDVLKDAEHIDVRAKCDADFDAFWDVYPPSRRGSSRAKLLAKWRSHCPNDSSKALDYVNEYLHSLGYYDKRDDTDYVRLMTTLINSDAWKDWSQGDLQPAKATHIVHEEQKEAEEWM